MSLLTSFYSYCLIRIPFCLYDGIIKVGILMSLKWGKGELPLGVSQSKLMFPDYLGVRCE